MNYHGLLLLTVILLLSVFLGACQHHRIVTPDGWEVNLARTMTDAQFESLEMETPEGFKLRIEGLKSETQRVVEAAVTAATREIVKRGP